MVVDAVILHWAAVVDGEDAGSEGFVRAVKKLAAIFYENGRLLGSSQLARLQEALGVLTDMLDRVGLRTNVDKTV